VENGTQTLAGKPNRGFAVKGFVKDGGATFVQKKSVIKINLTY
jgi:hypothetical protein